MKLFSNAELKEIKAKEQTREILRTQEMQQVADKARKELANAEHDFKLALAERKEVWAIEEQNHNTRVKERNKELSNLEEKRKAAMIPIDDMEKRAAKKLSEAIGLKNNLKKDQEDVDQLREVLEEKLDDMAEKNKRIESVEEQLANREHGIKMQEANISQSAMELSKQMASFLAEKAKGEQDIKERKEALFLKERSLLSKEEALKRTENKLGEWSIHLKEEREVLDRIYTRQKK